MENQNAKAFAEKNLTSPKVWERYLAKYEQASEEKSKHLAEQIKSNPVFQQILKKINDHIICQMERAKETYIGKSDIDRIYITITRKGVCVYKRHGNYERAENVIDTPMAKLFFEDYHAEILDFEQGIAFQAALLQELRKSFKAIHILGNGLCFKGRWEIQLSCSGEIQCIDRSYIYRRKKEEWERSILKFSVIVDLKGIHPKYQEW